MRTVKLKGRTVIKKNKENYRDPSAWKIPWTEEPVRLQSIGSQRVRHD